MTGFADLRHNTSYADYTARVSAAIQGRRDAPYNYRTGIGCTACLFNRYITRLSQLPEAVLGDVLATTV